MTNEYINAANAFVSAKEDLVGRVNHIVSLLESNEVFIDDLDFTITYDENLTYVGIDQEANTLSAEWDYQESYEEWDHHSTFIIPLQYLDSSDDELLEYYRGISEDTAETSRKDSIIGNMIQLLSDPEIYALLSKGNLPKATTYNDVAEWLKNNLK